MTVARFLRLQPRHDVIPRRCDDDKMTDTGKSINAGDVILFAF